MKKALLIALTAVLVLALAGGGLVAISWQRAGQVEVAAYQPRMAYGQGEAGAYGYTWRQPVLGGLLTREWGRNMGTRAVDLGTLDPAAAALPPVFSLGQASAITATRDGGTALDLTAGWFGGQAPAPGSYEVKATCTVPAEDGGAGDFYFWFTFTVAAAPEAGDAAQVEDAPPAEYEVPEEPTLDTGAATLRQGDVFSLQLRGVPEGVTPTASSDLGLALFTPMGGGRWTAAVPVGNTRQPGDYAVKVQVGERQFSATVTVETFPFDTQDLDIDLSDPVISEANSAAAIQEYNTVILAARAQADSERYWRGTFIWPTEGEITTHFGQIRYTNGDYSDPDIHWGMDIANDEGTPIHAAGAGRVEFAAYLLAVGYTVIIEHGGGLKTYHFHMSGLDVAAGDMVEQGQQIGRMGSTGYSTGDHLHFEVRIGGQAISPEMLFLPEAGLYGAERQGVRNG